VIVRLARRSLNYCTGLPFDGLNDDHVANLNAAVSAFFNGVSHTTTPKKLTQGGGHLLGVPRAPLTGHTRNSYPDAMASYQRNTMDVLEMLSSESVFYTQQMLDEECIEMLVGLRTVVLGGIGPVVKNEDEEWGALPPLPARPRPDSAVPTHGAMRMATPRPAAPRPAHRGGLAGAARPIKIKYKTLLKEEKAKVAELEATIAQLKAAEADDPENEALEMMQMKATRMFKNLTVTTLKEIYAK